MEIRIKETGEVKELYIYDSSAGVEWTQDLLGNYGALEYDEDHDKYSLSQEDFDWWEEYVKNFRNDENEIAELIELGVSEDEIRERIQKSSWVNGLEFEHNAIQGVLEEIREELKI